MKKRARNHLVLLLLIVALGPGLVLAGTGGEENESEELILQIEDGSGDFFDLCQSAIYRLREDIGAIEAVLPETGVEKSLRLEINAYHLKLSLAELALYQFYAQASQGGRPDLEECYALILADRLEAVYANSERLRKMLGLTHGQKQDQE